MNSFYDEKELEDIGFKSIGKNTKISRKCSIYGAQNISIGDNVRIDDFCILSGKIHLGNNIHIAAYSALYGGQDGISIDDFANLSSRVSVYSVSDDYSGETVAAWCSEHQISVATYYYWRKRVSANDEMLSAKEPVFAELTDIRKAALSKEKEPLLISFNQLQLAVSTPAQAELAAVLISRMQSLC